MDAYLCLAAHLGVHFQPCMEIAYRKPRVAQAVYGGLRRPPYQYRESLTLG